MVTFNLDEKRRERQAGMTPPPPLTFAEQEFTLPLEPSFQFWECIVDKDWRGAITQVLGDEQSQRFFASAPVVDDVAVFVDMVSAWYLERDAAHEAAKAAETEE
jgi:hypothetical protein